MDSITEKNFTTLFPMIQAVLIVDDYRPTEIGNIAKALGISRHWVSMEFIPRLKNMKYLYQKDNRRLYRMSKSMRDSDTESAWSVFRSMKVISDTNRTFCEKKTEPQMIEDTSKQQSANDTLAEVLNSNKDCVRMLAEINESLKQLIKIWE